MPPDHNDIHAKLGAHEAQLDGHRRELDGLWVNDKVRSAEITAVRIQIAKWLGLGGALFAIGQIVAAKIMGEMIVRAMGGN